MNKWKFKNQVMYIFVIILRPQWPRSPQCVISNMLTHFWNGEPSIKLQLACRAQLCASSDSSDFNRISTIRPSFHPPINPNRGFRQQAGRQAVRWLNPPTINQEEKLDGGGGWVCVCVGGGGCFSCLHNRWGSVGAKPSLFGLDRNRITSHEIVSVSPECLSFYSSDPMTIWFCYKSIEKGR